MIYKAIGVMSGSSLDGLDIAMVTFTEIGGKWSFELDACTCIEYDNSFQQQLMQATNLSAIDYYELDILFATFIGNQINLFIEQNNLQHQVQLITSHGHTTFHLPAKKLTVQLGNGATIAAITQLPVISDVRMLDVAFGGQGAPLVPIGDKLLFAGYDYYLNIGGIANITYINQNTTIAFDICAANKVLNMLAQQLGKDYDAGGNLAKAGQVNIDLLVALNALDYYQLSYPKSLSNSYGENIVFTLISKFGCSIQDSLCTYVEHMCIQIANAIQLQIKLKNNDAQLKMLVTGGGACNTYLVQQLTQKLAAIQVAIIIPAEKIILFKEAIIMAFLGILRWREEATVLKSVTGAEKSSIGGALWLGTEA
jgi:anhydro-N-acetylmuramic acid kinase